MTESRLVAEDAAPHDALTDAASNADVDTTPLAGTRFRLPKRVLVRVARLFTHKQGAYNRAMIVAERETRHSIEIVGHRLDEALAALHTDVTDLQTSLEVARIDGSLTREQVALLQADLARFASQVTELEQAVREVRRLQHADRLELRARSSVLESLARDLRRSRDVEWTRPTEPATAIDDELYRVLETAFRGDPVEIADRLRAYLPDITELGVTGPVVDLGSGRGEWLELLGEAGIDAYGIDTNRRSVEDSRARGLKVVEGDALDHLRSLPDATMAAISAFHLIEHLGFGDAVTLVDESLRVLRPGGLLLIETPNVNTMNVGASRFHLDPTHRQPVLPELLEVLLRERGFREVELRFFVRDGSPIPWPSGPTDVVQAFAPAMAAIDALLFGPADYAAIARR